MKLNYDKEREAFESNVIAKEYFASRAIRKDNYYVANLNSNRNKDKFYNGVIRMNAGWSAWQRRAEIAQVEEAKYKSLNGELIGKLHALQIKLKAEQDRSNQEREQATEYFTDCEFMKTQITELQQKLAKYENPDYVLVPRNPTNAMIGAGQDSEDRQLYHYEVSSVWGKMIEEVEKSKCEQ